MVELSKDYAAKREQLKRPAGAVKDGLVSFVKYYDEYTIPILSAFKQVLNLVAKPPQRMTFIID